MTNTDKWDIKERIDTNKDYIVNINEINNFIFDNEEWTNNLNELWNYLNWLSILQNNTDIIKRALMWYFLSNEWSNESKKIWDKVKANQPLEKRELTLLYLQMIDVYSRTGNKYQWNFDPNKPTSWELLTFIKKQYNHPTYNPQTSQSDAQKFQDNQRKDKSWLYTKETQTNIEIPQIPELNENNKDYIYNYCYKLMDWAEANFANDIANIRQNAKAKHYDVSEDRLSEYARYDILLFSFEKYCESITKNHENLVKQAWYKNNEEFQQQVEELGKLWEEIQSKYPNLDEALNILQKLWEEIENNKKKYFKNDDEVNKAQENTEQFNNFLETKTKEYKIDDIMASMEKDPETSEEAMAYFEWMNKIIKYQEEITQKSESYWDSIKNYQKYIQWNLEISKKYQNINEYIEVQKQYSEFIKWRQNKIDFDKYEKYNQLKENSGIDKDFHNISVLKGIIMDPQNEHFPILWVKNAAAEKQAKIDAFRTNLQKNNWPTYRLLTSLSWLRNGFISSTVGVWTWLGYVILSLCWKDTTDLNKRKEFYDNILKSNQSSQQNEPVYDPDSNSINLNWHNWVSTVSSQIANMLVLITGGSSIFWKWFSKIAWTTKNVAQGAKIAWVTEGIAHRVWVFSMSFITNIWQSFQEAKNKNLDWWAAFSYSMLSSIVQGALELLSPNEILVWSGSNITKELIKNLVKDGSKNSFMMLWKAFLKNVWMEIIEENFQEGLQLAVWNLINMYADGKRWTDFWADWSWKNFAQTAIITTLTTWITTWASYMLEMTNMNNDSTSKLFNDVVNNEWTYTAVMGILDKAISGQIKIPNTDIASLQQLKTAFLSVNDVWSNLHEEWRNTRLKEDWTYDPRIKTTHDETRIQEHNGQTEVDIANTTFENLPSDWQHENLEAAKIAESLVYESIIRWEDITTEMIEEMSSKVHEEWLKRNTRAKWWELDVPYDQLPESEKAKDRNQVLLAIEVTRQNSDNEYFNWKSHKFNVSWSQATLNSTTMDTILIEINKQNKSKKLKQLGKEISKQYEQATWEKIELTDEQLISILDAHEKDWVLWELTTWQLREKVNILSETITDPRVRRFLLEAWFCWSMANMLQAAQSFYQRNQTAIDDSINFVWRTINNAYKSSKKQNRKEYTQWEEVNVPRSDGSITHGAHIESYDPNTWTYLVIRYQNWQWLKKRLSTDELNSVNTSKENDDNESYYIWQQVNVPRSDGSITPGGNISKIDASSWKYLITRYQNWQNLEKRVTQDELNSANWEIIDTQETSNTIRQYNIWQEINIFNNEWEVTKATITEFHENNGLYKVEREQNWKQKFHYYTIEELNEMNLSNTDTQAQENILTNQIESTQSWINTERKEMSEVPRNSDVVAIWDLHWEYLALKWNLEYAWIAREVNWHLEWTGWHKKIVFQWDILSDRWTDGLKIISEIHQLKQQAHLQWWNIDIIVWNHDDFMISYLTWRNWIHKDWIDVSIADRAWWIYSWQWRWILELIKYFYTWKPYYLSSSTYDFKKTLRNGHDNILSNMRNNPEWRIILEEICNMKVVSQIDDVLYCHTNPTEWMLQYLTNWNVQDNIDIINQKYQWYLRKILLWERWPTISTKEFNQISDLFLDTNNRDIWWIEKYVDQLRNSWINMISHWHSGGGWKWNWQYVYDNNQTDINWLKIVDADFSYWKGGREWWTHSISIVQQNWWNIITWNN